MAAPEQSWRADGRGKGNGVPEVEASSGRPKVTVTVCWEAWRYHMGVAVAGGDEGEQKRPRWVKALYRDPSEPSVSSSG